MTWPGRLRRWRRWCSRCSRRVSDTVGTLTHDVAGAVAPVEAVVQPVLTTVSDTVGTLTHDVAGAVAPVEAVVQPVLTTVSDTVGTLTHDVAGTLAPVEAVVQPVLTTVSDTVGTLAHDVAGTLAPVEAAVQPVLTTVSDTVGTLTHDVAGAVAPVEAVVQPVLTIVSDTVGTLTHDVAGNNASAVPDAGTGQAAGPADTLLALATSRRADRGSWIGDGYPGQRCDGCIERRGGRPPDHPCSGRDCPERRATTSSTCSVHRKSVYRLRRHAEQRRRSCPAECRVPGRHRIGSRHFGARGRGCPKTGAAASRHRGYDSSNRSPWTCHPVAGVEHGGRRDTAQSAAQPICGSTSRRTGRRIPQ